MAKVINLRTRRKQAARVEARQSGDVNAAKHGRTGAEVTLSKACADKARRDLDGHEREAGKPD